VIEIAQAECAPLSHDFSADYFTVPGRSEKVAIEYNHVSPEYFSVVGIPIVRGAAFSWVRRPNSTGIIVPESTAQRLWPGEDPLGKHCARTLGASIRLLGVTRDAQVSHLGDVKTPYLYFPAGATRYVRTYVMVRFAGSFTPVAKAFARPCGPSILTYPSMWSDSKTTSKFGPLALAHCSRAVRCARRSSSAACFDRRV